MQVFKEIEVADLAILLKENQKNVSLIDIRNPVEANQESIPGSENVPMHQLPLRLDKIQEDQLVILYCQVGVRSARACAYLSINGFDNVHNLRGGIQAWKSSGLEVA